MVDPRIFDDEYQLQRAVCLEMDYLYPGLVYRSSMDGYYQGRKQRARNKAVQYMRGWPDWSLWEPRAPLVGLQLELKLDRREVFNVGKGLKSSSSRRVIEQSAVIFWLRKLGWMADFSIGFDDAMTRIQFYLNANVVDLINPPFPDIASEVQRQASPKQIRKAIMEGHPLVLEHYGEIG